MCDFEVLRKMKVVNDCAERGVKLMTDFSQCLTTKTISNFYCNQIAKIERIPLTLKKKLRPQNEYRTIYE